MNFNKLFKFSILLSICVTNFGFLSCESKKVVNQKIQQQSLNSFWKNEPDYTIIPFDKKTMYYLDLESSAELSDVEIQKIEILLKEYIMGYNSIVKKNIEESNQKTYRTYKIKTEDHLLELANYKRQYIPALNSNGEKVVWVNCFCKSNILGDWKSEVVYVHDGGNCYFNLKINLTIESVYELRVNGVA